MTSEIKRRFTDTEMQTARETDLPELLTHLGYQVKRIGRYYTTAEMDSLRIKDRRTWFRYSQGIGGDAITFLQQFCDKTFPEAVEYLLTFQGRPRDAPVKTKPVTKQDKPSEQFALPPRNADDRRVFAYLTDPARFRNGHQLFAGQRRAVDAEPAPRRNVRRTDQLSQNG